MKFPSYAQVAKNLGIPQAALYGWLDRVQKRHQQMASLRLPLALLS